MKIIDARTVELSDREMRCRAKFERLLDKGFGIEFAARQVLEREVSWVLDPFVKYLSDGTLALDAHGSLVSTRHKPDGVARDLNVKARQE